MCNLVTPITKKRVTGYKIAVKKQNRYYSPIVGMIYRVGQIKVPKKQNLYLDGFSDNLLEPQALAYRKLMVGRTSVVVGIGFARELISYYRKRAPLIPLVMLRMVISKEIIKGTVYGEYPVCAGKEIVSMEEVKI